jgi:hypothetical protein
MDSATFFAGFTTNTCVRGPAATTHCVSERWAPCAAGRFVSSRRRASEGAQHERASEAQRRCAPPGLHTRTPEA